MDGGPDPALAGAANEIGSRNDPAAFREAPVAVSDPSLIQEQQGIVEFGEGPLLVVAGPGSGKTRVLAERFVKLVRDERARPDQILTLAYNAEAASEMARRVATRLGPGDYPIWTFHGFARRTIAELGWLAELPTSFRLVSHRVEQWLRIKNVVEELKPRHFYPPLPRRDLRMLQGFVSRAKQEAVPPDRILDWATRQRTGRDDAADQLAQLYEEAAAVYQRLEDLYRQQLCFDFDDLILSLAQALDQSPALKDALVGRYRYFMVDEYQDTNYTQSLLLERLVPPPFNLVVVADDDQSIYKFRGASLTNIHRFKRLMPGVTELSLGRNHRSTPEIVGASSALIGLYSPREAKELRSEEPSGRKITILEAPDAASEAAWVSEQCEQLVREHRVPPDQVAVLARTNAHLQPFAAALAERQLPYELSGGGDLFYRPEIKDLMALVRAAVAPSDDLALVRLLRLPPYAVSSVGRIAVTEWLRSSGQPLFQTYQHVSGLTDSERDRMRQLVSDIRELADLALRSSAREVVFRAMELSRHVGVMARQDAFERYEGAANVRRFAELAELFDADHPGAQLEELLGFLELARDADTEQAHLQRDLSEPAIKLYTAHSSKGLEFDHVFVVNAAEGRFPIRAQERLLDIPAELAEEELSASSPIDEERRLFYVAMTRARKTLVCTYARKYNEWARTPSEPSQFLVELRGRVPELLEEKRSPQALLPPVRPTRPRLTKVPPAQPFTVSQLLTFSDCPRQFAYAYEFHLPQRQNQELVLGNLIHTVLEEGAHRRMAGQEVASKDFAGMLELAWSAANFDKLSWASLKDDAGQLLRSYTASPAWLDANISAAETSFDLDLDGFQFRGRIDRIDVRSGRHTLVDYKSGRARTADEARKDRRLARQFGIYKLAAKQILGAGEIDLEAHFVSGPTVVEVPKDDEQLERDRRWAWAVAKSINEARAVRTFPVQPGDFTCPYCPFQLVCDQGQTFLRSARTRSESE